MSIHPCNENHSLIVFVHIANMVNNLKSKILFILFWVYTATAIPSQFILSEDDDENIAAAFPSNNYIPRESDLPDDRVFSLGSDEDITKLSDQQLIALLQNQEEDKIAKKAATYQNLDSITKKESVLPTENHSSDEGVAYFKLENKAVEPLNFNFGADPIYLAKQRIKNLLHSQPAQNLDDVNSDESDEKKELLFDILTSQLKKLCCKSNKVKTKSKLAYEPLLNNALPKSRNPFRYEQMFLIINDEIKSDQDTEDIVLVDPDSLNENSTVLLLGPITTPLTDRQLKTVMNRITVELSKPEYNPLLQELSQGKVSTADTRLVKSLVSGSNTRRYIKPHRCNIRYKQSYNPKWLICTGYLNINTPSIYD